jgi:hypothetical protein
MSSQPYNPMTNYHRNVCEWCGGFGALLSLVCLVQHLILAIPNKTTNPMIPYYFLAITAFILLALQKTVSLIFLYVSTAISLIVVWVWMRHYAFSLVVTLLFIYHIIILVVLYAEQIPQKLKEKRRLELEEEKFWDNKY